MGPRAGFSALLVLAGIVLLAAIAIGNRMGDHVLGASQRRPDVAPTILPTTAAPYAASTPRGLGWKHRDVISVATDPAFPDPRVTPPTPTPSPSAAPTPAGLPPEAPLPAAPADPPTSAPYTSPPLPIPLGPRRAPETVPSDGVQ